MSKEQKNDLLRIAAAALLYVPLFVLERLGRPELPNPVWLGLFLLPYLLVGYDVVWRAVRNIAHGQIFDENFLMLLATVGASGTGEYAEAVAVMLLYQVGELFQSCAVGKSRRSIAQLMDICPEYANVERDGRLEQVDPDEVEVGTEIVIRPGERVPLDGVVLEGSGLIDTAALTGEAVPRRVSPGQSIVSGCVNGQTTLRVRTTKAFENSTVSKILELVENAAEKKAKTENFITRFARWYTPAVTVAAALLALVPTLLLGQAWSTWVHRACVFLVISCPCALVISVPLGFFGGIGAASKSGILVKGGSYLEQMSRVTTLVMDKTGTLTKGEFRVSEIQPMGISQQELLEVAALGEGYSSHPVAAALRAACPTEPELSRMTENEELPGLGIRARVDGKELLLGNEKLMQRFGIDYAARDSAATVVYAALDGCFLGSIVISDTVKPGAKEALAAAKTLGVDRLVLLTGDREAAARALAKELGIDTVHAQLLPAQKVEQVEKLLQTRRKGECLAFVGDGINDAPVLSLADVGIAMGKLGSDAAIEAADIVLMDDDVGKLASAVRISRRTLAVVRQNIFFALAVKALTLLLGAIGAASLWAAVFADVGVAVLAILNSMRALQTKGNIAQ